MSSLERLPPDQRAVLALVLQRGRSYDEIANLLAIDRAAVRDRALAALDALGPSEPRVPPERRALITDYLLGQLPDRVRDDVRDRLARSAGDRAWARVLAGELAPIASEPLPEIPAADTTPTPEPATTPEAASPQPAATPQPTPASEPTATPQPTRGSEPTAIPELAPTAAAASPAAEPASAPSASRSLPPPMAAQRPSSRRGGGIFLAVALAILVVVVIVVLVSSNGSSTKTPSKHHASTTPTTATQTTGTGTSTASTTTPVHVIATINLRPPSSSSKEAGIVRIVTEGKVTGVIVAADHLPANTAHNAYAVWLATPGGASHLLGYVSPGVTKTGNLTTSGPLPANYTSYKELLITLETTTSKKGPGPTVLAGRVPPPAG